MYIRNKLVPQNIQQISAYEHLIENVYKYDIPIRIDFMVKKKKN